MVHSELSFLSSFDSCLLSPALLLVLYAAITLSNTLLALQRS